MATYIKATPEGDVPMTPEEVVAWEAHIAKEAEEQALRAVENPEPTIPTTTP